MEVTKENLKDVIEKRDIDSILNTFKGFMMKNASKIAKLTASYIDEDDFYQIGCMAICENIDKFKMTGINPEKDFGNFIRFFTIKIRFAMLKAKNKTLSKLSIPSHVATKIYKAYAINEVCGHFPDDVIIRLIQVATKSNTKVAIELLTIVRMKFESLDTPSVIQDFESNEKGDRMAIAVDERAKIDAEYDAVSILETISNRITRSIVEQLIVNKRNLSYISQQARMSVPEVLGHLKRGVTEMREQYAIHNA